MEFVFLGVLLLVPLVYLVLMLGRLQAGAYAVSAAARESGRAFVTAETVETAPGRAQTAALLAFENLGFAEGSSVTVRCDADPCLRPGVAVHSAAQVSVPLPLVPAFVRSVIPLQVTLHAANVTIVDRFRAVP